ncbi:MAG: hypothetical protein AB7O88_26915 [Reyranellaceae bacterium]
MRRAIRYCAVSMSLVAMLPACAPTSDRWNKDGSTAEARDSTFAACRSAANARMASAPPPSTYQQIPAAGGVVGILAGALVLAVVHGAAKGAATNASIDSCMREAGFARPQAAPPPDWDRKDGSSPPPANTNIAPAADCSDGAGSPGPRSSLLVHQPPVSCTPTQTAPSKADRAT